MMGPPGGAAELILLENVPVLASQVVFPSIRIQLVILQNFKQNTMDIVGAGFQDDVHDAAGRAAVFSVCCRS